MKEMYLRFVALTSIPLNVVLAVIMSAYAKYKWQAPLAKSLRMWYHANMRTIFFGIGCAEKESQYRKQ